MSPLTPPAGKASLDAFSLFPRLPKELRISIWSFAANIPRTLTIHKYFSHIEDTQYLYTKDPTPVILHVCRESRFESPYTASFSVGTIPRYIWVNFNVDTIRCPDYALQHIKPDDRAQIRWAILEADDSRTFLLHEMPEIYKMDNLEELTILSVSDLRVWIEIFEQLVFHLNLTFERRQGWVCPMIRVIERSTGEQLNSLNFSAISPLLEARGAERSYGFEADINTDEATERLVRRGLEWVQRDRRHEMYNIN